MKKTYTESVYRWDTSANKLVLISEEWFWDSREPAACKASQEERSLAAKQAAFYDTMIESQKQIFAGKQAILDKLTAVWQPILNAGSDQYGFTKAQDTALRTQATEGTAAEYNKAQKALQQVQSARGGGNEVLPSGVDEQVDASLAASAAAAQSQKNLDITNAGYERGYQKFIAATSALSGVGAQYDPVGFSNSTINAGASAFDSAHQISMEDSAWQGILGGVVGSLGSAAITGGFSMASTPKPPAGCWIAAAIYGGWDEPRTVLVREWLNTEFVKSKFGAFVMKRYLKYGERIAAFVTKHRWAKYPFLPVFNLALKKAKAWKATVE